MKGNERSGQRKMRFVKEKSTREFSCAEMTRGRRKVQGGRWRAVKEEGVESRGREWMGWGRMGCRNEKMGIWWKMEGGERGGEQNGLGKD